MKNLARLLVVVGLLALLAAGAAYLFMQDEESDAAKATEKPVSLISSAGMEKSIRERLTARTGREVVAECPDKVNELVGTKFECQVFYKNEKTVATVAKVEITGGGGQFKWSTENAPNSTPSATPTP